MADAATAQAQDFVIASGITHTVRDCVAIAFDQAGVTVDDNVAIDPAFVRPEEVDLLIGHPGKAKRILDWEPATTFEQMIRWMVDADHALLKRGERSAAAASEI